MRKKNFLKIKKGELLLLPCLLLCASAEQQPSHPIHPSIPNCPPTHRPEQNPGTRASAPPPRRAPRAEDTGEMMGETPPAGWLDRSIERAFLLRECGAVHAIDRSIDRHRGPQTAGSVG